MNTTRRPTKRPIFSSINQPAGRILEAVEKSNRRHRLIQKKDGVVVALSGGPDSTALLLLLSILQKKYSLKIFAAHVNHGISAAQSSEFQNFSQKLARRLNLPFFKKKIHLKTLAKKNKKTLEEMGRIVRYDFFKEIAKKTGAKKIATAHTLDDQAETVLMRVARGTGLKGLGGIPFKRKEGGYEIIRPFLEVSKKEVLAFLKKSHEPYCRDASNATDVFTRNRVRNQLLPWMEKNLNPQVKTSLSDLGALCARTQTFMEGLAERELERCLVKKKGGHVFLNGARLKRLDTALRSETIFAALALLGKGRLRFTSRHIDAIGAILDSPEGKLETHLPGRIVVTKGVEGTFRIFDTSSK